MPSSERAVDNRFVHTGFVRLITGLVVGAVVLAAFILNIEDSALARPGDEHIRAAVRTVLPEQWAFFTKSPRDQAIIGIPDADLEGGPRFFPQAQLRFFGGADRSARAAGIEIGVLMGSVAADDWQWCAPGAAAAECARSPIAAAIAPSPAKGTPQLCGNVTLIRETPAPWAFARAGSPGSRLEVTRVNARC